MSFSYALKVVRLIPLAIRVSAAGGVAYGSVKVGLWSPKTQDSKEKLTQLQREIHYPTSEKVHCMYCTIIHVVLLGHPVLKWDRHVTNE